MLGARLRRSRNACGHGCCDWHDGARRRKTKNERQRDARRWRKEN